MVPGDVVELVEGMEELVVMGTVMGHQKVTKIEGLEDMGSLTVRGQSATTSSFLLQAFVHPDPAARDVSSRP